MTTCNTESTGNEEASDGPRFYGKYRGKVVSITDPLQLGRIMAIVPSVSQINPTTWAYPCSPFAGFGVGMFFVPPLGANVWIEFEEGNLENPIWTGGFWDEKDLAPIIPKPFLTPGEFTITTIYGRITLSDMPPGIRLKTKDEMTISLDITGIRVSLPGAMIMISKIGTVDIKSPTKISITAPTQVSINGL